MGLEVGDINHHLAGLATLGRLGGEDLVEYT